jgi:capsid protein
MPSYGGSDVEVGTEAASWLENVWYPVCDIAGNGSDWHEFLELVSKNMDRDGESFVMLTQSDSGFPHVQHIPAHMVWSKADLKRVDGGPYNGLKIEDGVITNTAGRAVAYRVNKDDQGKEFDDISARDLIHVFDRDFSEQQRGYPAFSHALDGIKNSMSSQELETIRQNLISSIFLVERTDAIDSEDPAWDASVNTTNQDGLFTETNEPGVRHIQSNESLELIKHEVPGDVWESFQDRIIRDSIVGIGWAYSLIWKSPGQGTAERAEVVRARKAVESRQKKLRHVAYRAITYAVGVASSQSRRTIQLPGNMLKWSFNKPERLTVDDGRESRALLEAVEKGFLSAKDYHAFRGKSEEDHLRDQANSLVLKAKVAREVSESNQEGIAINPEDLGAAEANKQAPIMEEAV